MPMPKGDGFFSLCCSTLVLSYCFVLSFTANGILVIAAPIDLAIFEPSKAALLNGILGGISACISLFGPVVGHFADKHGKRFYMILGSVFFTVGIMLLLVGVYTRYSETLVKHGLGIYFIGIIIAQVGSLLLSTCFNAMVADLTHEVN